MTTQMTGKLKILSYGAGAIGTYIGGSLALHGHSVIFLERPEVAAQLLERGIRLKLHDREHSIPEPTVAASLDEALQLGPFDLALFALKSFDTQTALHSLQPRRAELPPFLCLQNGVENEGLLVNALGEQSVIAGTVTSAIGRRAAGDILLERQRGVGIASGHPLSDRLVAEFTLAGLNAHSFPSAAEMKWSKMLTNLLANATSAILNLTPAEVFAHKRLYRLEVEQLRECLQVMRAMNLNIVDLPGTPVRLLAMAVQRLPVSLSRPFLKKAVGSGRGGKMPSFYIDLQSGRGVTEVDALNGAVARFGSRHNVPAPVNHLLTQILTAMVNGEISLDAYAHNPDKLLSSIYSR